MPATGFAAVLLALTVGFGIGAVVRGSRRLGLVALAAFVAFVAYTGLLVLLIGQM